MNRLINASAHDTGIEDGSVHCILTSPPYLGLRKYQGNQGVMWQSVTYAPMAGLPTITIPAMQCDLGMEPTPEAYIGHLMLVMREMWRVLRDDGVCWVNLGDSYNGSGGPGSQWDNKATSGLKVSFTKYENPNKKLESLKPKDKCLIPARFALAAQADGWYVRSDLPWLKRNGMPESADDRPTTTIEYVYLLAKSQSYFFDAEAIKQPARDWGERKRKVGERFVNGVMPNGQPHAGLKDGNFSESGRLFRSSDLFFKTFQGLLTNEDEDPLCFVVNTNSYSGAHFATWPEKLCEPMILAGTSAKGVCPKCGAQHERITEKGSVSYQDTGNRKRADALGAETSPTSVFRTGEIREILTTGWQPTCTCDAGEPIPATVLDPFNGSGTSGRTANRLGRYYIGVDISNEYLTELSPERLGNIQTQMCF